MSDHQAQARELALGAEKVLPALGDLADRLAEGRPLRVKLGIDPTAPDIHLGHVVVLEKLRQFQAAGHLAVLIIGDYTARVGDPSGRSSERPVLSADQIEANAETFTAQAFRVLDRDRTEVRRNSEWLDMDASGFLDLARRFTVNQLAQRKTFKQRWDAEESVTVLEMLYPVLQGYDSVEVVADVELGGSDQEFNLFFGRDVQRSFGMPRQVGMTMPILPGVEGGTRMSKSAGNYIGVTEEPAEMFGKLMSIPDHVMGLYWTLLLGEELDAGRHPGEAKRELGRRLVDRFHAPGDGAAAEARFDEVHVHRGIPDDLDTLPLPGGEEVHLPAVIAEAFATSASEARRLIGQGAVRLDGETVPADALDLPPEQLTGRVLQVGKRRFVRLLGPT